MKRILAFMAIATLTISGASSANKDLREPVDFVNPYMGNISHLLVPTYPTVHRPYSMLRVYPERSEYTVQRIDGLPVIVTSHRGRSAFKLSPTSNPQHAGQPSIRYSYDQERIAPYEYAVRLDEEGIDVQFAPASQAAIYRFDYDDPSQPMLVISTSNGDMEYADGEVRGFQRLDNGVKVYVTMCFSVPVTGVEQLNDRALCLSFAGGTSRVEVRYGVSFIDNDQAARNLEREIPRFDLEGVAAESRNIWNETLGKIKVEGSDDDKTTFYTSMYRVCERMIGISEDGRYYSAFDGKVHDDGGVPFYTDDWVWDTYRAAHPLRVIIEPELETAMINSYIRMAQQTDEGWMPTFPEVTGDSHRMNGNHAVAIVADAWTKGLHGFDLEAAYKACKGALTEKSLLPWTRQPNTVLDEFYAEHGYFPAIFENTEDTVRGVHGFEKRQPVCVTLGTSYDDWCLSRIAEALGHSEDADHFKQRSLNYRNIYNPNTGFFHPRYENGDFIEPLDYRYSGGMGGRYYYDENNGWIFRWDVQHNIPDLISLMGGNEAFCSNLDEMFTGSLDRDKRAFYTIFADQTAGVGLFSMANEPCLHVPYLYNYGGQPWKTQKMIRSLLKMWFRNDLMGIPGDEDGGGMSAFVVFSKLGFYPVTPGSDKYTIGSPAFTRAELDLGGGKRFTVIARGASDTNKYIRSATINGRPLNRPWITHDDIMQGGELIFEMGDKPNYEWGIE